MKADYYELPSTMRVQPNNSMTCYLIVSHSEENIHAPHNEVTAARGPSVTLVASLLFLNDRPLST
jgi:hypothetical protein